MCDDDLAGSNGSAGSKPRVCTIRTQPSCTLLFDRLHWLSTDTGRPTEIEVRFVSGQR